ncbi:liver-expressed antimicrobial peptide 2-like [Astyanax mexicanus]|uniref:Liver-expressed antimicrobial peptide 2 n=2 Tax=Astyanax mexicanus TaxID=7994 RepID=A0A8B9H8D4_ASTMX|nr:liver-expressed antimicrobial peptide 2-like [Astyanax mexicanus]KAG9265700.1 liver-expressed antimicrobial peptide 2 [Astyanax mexicanus]
MTLYSRAVLGLCLLALLFTVHQGSSAPAVAPEATLNLQQSDVLLNRKARMSPVWRIFASKPPGAYCHDHIECSTGLCRRGFCSFNQPVHS